MSARLTLLLAALPSVLAAQVGHLPENSPFRDVTRGPRIVVFGGYYSAAKDEAGVLPKSAPLLGVKGEVHLGGPADVYVRLAHVSTERDVIDPTHSAGTRLVETRNTTLAFGDIGLSFSLTGAKSWHKVQPTINGGVGLVSDFKGADVGGFKHGTTFTVGYGLGLRYVPPGSRFSLRGDVGSYMYSLEYPLTYYTPAGDGTSVLTQKTQRSQWRNNWTLSLGASYFLFR